MRGKDISWLKTVDTEIESERNEDIETNGWMTVTKACSICLSLPHHHRWAEYKRWRAVAISHQFDSWITKTNTSKQNEGKQLFDYWLQGSNVHLRWQVHLRGRSTRHRRSGCRQATCLPQAASLPGAETRLPGAETRLSGAETRLPGAKSHLPGARLPQASVPGRKRNPKDVLFIESFY